MTPEEIELVIRRLERAHETLGEARALLGQGFTFGVVNRAYYACFYAVTALLLTERRSSSKHSGVRSLFNQHWVNPGRFDPDLGKFYNRLFERRLTSDYRDEVAVDRSDAETSLGQAESFVNEISEWLRQHAGVE